MFLPQLLNDGRRDFGSAIQVFIPELSIDRGNNIAADSLQPLRTCQRDVGPAVVEIEKTGGKNCDEREPGTPLPQSGRRGNRFGADYIHVIADLDTKRIRKTLSNNEG